MEKLKYIYILSQRYSGSTLLSFLLATNPEVSTIGERRKFYNKSLQADHSTAQHCSCGALFKDCPYWNTVKRKFLEKTDPGTLKTNFTEFQLFQNKYLNKLSLVTFQKAWLYNLNLPLLSKKVRALCSLNYLLVKEILDHDGNSSFLDSSKSIDHALLLSLIPEFDFKVIWLVRDPRAQVNSALKYNNWSIHEAVRLWKKEMKNNQRILDKIKVPYTRLRYEDLCRAPEEEMKKLHAFLGLDPSGFSLNFRGFRQHIMGNTPMRLGDTSKIEERKEWLQMLRPDQIQTIEKQTLAYKEFYSE